MTSGSSRDPATPRYATATRQIGGPFTLISVYFCCSPMTPNTAWPLGEKEKFRSLAYSQLHAAAVIVRAWAPSKIIKPRTESVNIATLAASGQSAGQRERARHRCKGASKPESYSELYS